MLDNPFLTHVLENSKTTGNDRTVLIVIACHADIKTGIATPGDKRIAQLANVDERTVRRIIPRLIKAGEIRIHGGGIGRGKQREIEVLLTPPEIQKADTVVPLSADQKADTDAEKADNSNTNADTVVLFSDEEKADNSAKSGHLDAEKRTFDAEKADTAPHAREELSLTSQKLPEVATAAAGYGSRDSPAWKAYTDNIPGTLTPVIVDSINELLEQYSEWEFVRAVTIACERGNRNLAYIRGILQRGVDSRKRSPGGNNGYGKQYGNGTGATASSPAPGREVSSMSPDEWRAAQAKPNSGPY